MENMQHVVDGRPLLVIAIVNALPQLPRGKKEDRGRKVNLEGVVAGSKLAINYILQVSHSQSQFTLGPCHGQVPTS